MHDIFPAVADSEQCVAEPHKVVPRSWYCFVIAVLLIHICVRIFDGSTDICDIVQINFLQVMLGITGRHVV